MTIASGNGAWKSFGVSVLKIDESGFSLGILNMRTGLPAWCNLASQNEKYVYRYQNMLSHGPTKCLPE